MLKQPEAERRYSDRELGLILKLAAQRQESIFESNRDGLSLAEIQQIAATAGIDPKFITEAAAALEAQADSQGPSFLGAPTKFRFERTVAGEVPESEFSEIIEVIRRATGLQGQVSHMLDSLEWKGSDNFDRHTYVTIKGRGGETKIKVFGHWWGPALLLYMGTAIGGLLATLGVGLLIDPDSAIGIGALAVGGLGSTYLAARTLWQRASSKTESKLRKLLGRVEDAVAAAPGATAPTKATPQTLPSQTERK
jgi:hypothetical protein